MSDDLGRTHDWGTLRERAEALMPDGRAPDSPSEPYRLIHELRIHQIELELQNEELRLSRDEAEQQRARYAILYDFAPTGYLTLAPDGTIGDANRAAAALLGREAGALAGTQLGTFIAANERESLNTFLDDVFSASAPVAHELSIAADFGNVRLVTVVGERSSDYRECRVSMTDITQRRRAEAALRMRDRAFAAVSQGILITDPHAAGHPIIYANEGFERMTGYHAMEAVGRNCRFLQGPDTDRAAVRQLSAAIAAEEPCSVELVNYRKDGTPFWNALSVMPVRDDRGKLVQYIGVLIDVSEHRAAERALRQAQRMESVGRLAGGIAHDFNNLLTVINGNSEELAALHGADSPGRAMAGEISFAGERAATLTHQLLAFSRSNVAQPQVIDLHKVISGSLRALRMLTGERNSVQAVLAQEPLHVRMDPAQMEQILGTLVTHARDASTAGDAITLATTRLSLVAPDRLGSEQMPAGAYAQLTVSYTATGVDPETAARAFEPFGTGVRAGQSNGLGLAMVHGLIAQSLGYISIEPTTTHGSAFVIRLPLQTRPLGHRGNGHAPS